MTVILNDIFKTPLALTFLPIPPKLLNDATRQRAAGIEGETDYGYRDHSARTNRNCVLR